MHSRLNASAYALAPPVTRPQLAVTRNDAYHGRRCQPIYCGPPVPQATLVRLTCFAVPGRRPRSRPSVIMEDMAVVEAWFEGGPVAGRFMAIETTMDGQPAMVIVLPQTGVYIGSCDEPAPAVEHRHVLVDNRSADLTYRYDGPVLHLTRGPRRSNPSPRPTEHATAAWVDRRRWPAKCSSRFARSA
jgi:hypothetical protein